MNSKKVVLGLLIGIAAKSSFAQVNSTSQLKGGNINAITTAVPLLLISPDSRAGAMGECGAATSPDINSMHWNASKYAFMTKKLGFSASYSPWLRQLVPDISLAYLAGYGKLDKNSAIGGSLRYFSLGNITFTDVVGNTTGNFKPNEFAVDVAYTRKLGERFSAAMALRYINSNLTGGVNVNGSNTHAGQAVAVDISGYYTNNDIKISGKKSTLSFGFNVSNIGNKMSYTDNASPDAKNFLPMNLKLGSCLKLRPDESNSFSFTADINKLLVPTPPIYKRDASNNIVLDANGEKEIEAGKDPHRSVASGLFGSFSDAPGGFKEELREIILQGGVEYWYEPDGVQLFAVRAGYFHEDKTKGGRQFFTMGIGVKYNVFGFDFAYLVPTARKNNPLQNTLRFSLSFDFDAFNKQNKETAGDNQ
jgi:hypothetical protein